MSVVFTILKYYFLAVFAAMMYNFYLRKKGLKGVRYRSLLSPKKLFSVFYGFLLSIILPQHIFEQLVLRVYDPYCRSKCLKGNMNRCIHCGCNVYAKMMSPFEEDSNYNWGKIIFSRSEYERLRSKYPVDIKVVYKKSSKNKKSDDHESV